jgi:hypothetical protein
MLLKRWLLVISLLLLTCSCANFCPKCPPPTVTGIKAGQVIVDAKVLQETLRQRDDAVMRLKKCLQEKTK